MGFGYGRTTHWSNEAYNANGERVRKVYDSSMVAHIWNAQSQTFARTSNGNFAFEGASVYSYGTEWIVATLFNEAALINNRRISVTTSGHESDARGACRNRVRFELPEITSALASWLGQIESAMKAKRKAEAQALARRGFKLADYAAALAARKSEPGEYHWSGGARDGEGEPLGEFIANFVGLKASEYHNAAARLARAAARKAEAEAKRERERFIAEAARLADMSGSDFRESITLRDTSYNGERNLRDMAKRLRTARLKAGLSKTRRARLWEREKIVRARIDSAQRLQAIANRRSRLASLIRYVRQMQQLTTSGAQAAQGFSVWSSRQWQTLTSNIAELSGCAALRGETRDKLGALSDACAIELDKARERERLEREAEAEARRIEYEKRNQDIAANRAAWIAGEPLPFPMRGVGRDFQRDDGTPYIRIEGEELLTSWGASVPLAHAIKAFRFVKLCRERGQAWQRNGRTIRVGHFQIDSIDASGDFVAGCHRFAWPEIERAARVAGVFDLAADESAVESKESA